MKQRLGSSRRSIAFHRGSERGFTLVELLVVVGIFVALVSLTVPNYLANRPFRLLSGETMRLAGVIRQGRMFALRDNEKVYLEFLPEIDMYRLWSHSGWRAYRDPINGDGELTDRHPEIGDYDGDFDGDGDYYWDGGPSGVPEDPDVKGDAASGWYYEDSDGIYLDPDVLLMPTYPGNQPIRTVSPKLRISIDQNDPERPITNITRDFGDTRAVGGEGTVPFEVDIRMLNFTDNWDPAMPLGKRNGVLSHFPLLFIVFFPDGTLACSWDADNPPASFAEEMNDLAPGRLGATQIHLQVRGQEFNSESYNLFNPVLILNYEGDEGPSEPLSPYNTLSIEDSNSDAMGRVITLNNLSGRLIIRNFPPADLDNLYDSDDIIYL